MHDPPQRLFIRLTGSLQGVGFRPFVYRLALASALCGRVANTREGVVIEVEGPGDAVQRFLARLTSELPPHAEIETLDATPMAPAGYRRFTLEPSETRGRPPVFVLPDIAACPDCLAETFDPANRRYRYPFTSCAHCGPRWSIVEALPFDRERTAMKNFGLCPACRAEYENPDDRRFHAQTTSCPACGPRLALWDSDGRERAVRDEALRQTVSALRAGAIVALKGIGGFQLLADARDEAAVARLRIRKARPSKPLAVMVASLERVWALCRTSPLEENALMAPAAPIVLLRRRVTEQSAVAPSVAPDNPYLGVMLACSPLHHLLLADFGAPLVATSGNLSGEPICTDEREALSRLANVADIFLVHDRPILRALDDSVLREVGGRELLLRRARGYAPVVKLRRPLPSVLAAGGHLKNAIAAGLGDRAFVSQHLGDLDTAEARANFARTVAEAEAVFGARPERVACDLHPDYASGRYAESCGKPLVRIQHHYAHVLSCMAENDLEPPVLGIAWDGLGLGGDGTLWGGEFLLAGTKGFRRAAHFRSFPLPGGERAAREPRRAALGLLYEWMGEAAFERTDLAPVSGFAPQELKTLAQMLKRGLNAPRCSSVGRLFDAVASLLGLRQINGFEGEAAMAVEFAAEQAETIESYPFALVEPPAGSSSRRIVDWEPAMAALLDDMKRLPPAVAAAKFHRTLAAAAVAVAEDIGIGRIALSGGAFQNRVLTELIVSALESAGFDVFRHGRIPPNDGGLALGQLMAAARLDSP